MPLPRLLPLILFTLLLMVILNLVGVSLITPAAPMGIISFELAGSPVRANLILGSWDAAAQRNAAFSLGLDYLFMFAYAAAISVACLKGGRLLQTLGWPLSDLARPLAYFAWLAVFFDAIENLALTVTLLSGVATATWPLVAWVCAVLKFGLIFLGLSYAFYTGAIYFVSRLSHIDNGKS